ncbi:hypothetical protein DMENIID0001_028090 [Sergentomyia squamirostris]
MRANEQKSVQVTFTLKRNTCPPVKLNDVNIPQAEEVKYLGMHLDKRLTWRNHIKKKRLQLNLKCRHLYWLLGKKSKVTTENKLLIYKSIIKPVWTYGIQMWGIAAKSNLDIFQRFQNRVLRQVLNAPWYVTNEQIHRDLNMSTIREEILAASERYRGRLISHPNSLANHLAIADSPRNRRLTKGRPSDLYASL